MSAYVCEPCSDYFSPKRPHKPKECFWLSLLNEMHTNSYTGPRLITVLCLDLILRLESLAYLWLVDGDWDLLDKSVLDSGDALVSFALPLVVACDFSFRDIAFWVRVFSLLFKRGQFWPISSGDFSIIIDFLSSPSYPACRTENYFGWWSIY